ncbi:MAG: chromosomal replication initiator protein DnaA [Bacteroidetes bacterium]|jgi:chromosomal replication initiator protein|nr:chromosomal replication initiator protein DnaA [Bacteroidota bacterium]
MEQTPEEVWNQCLEIIRDNISRQSFKTWFEPLTAVDLKEDGDLVKLTVQLPSRFYYEWLEEHYFGLLRKTITKVLGPQGRLFYNVVIEKDAAESGYEGSSMQLPARRPSGEPPPAQSGPGTPAPHPDAAPSPTPDAESSAPDAPPPPRPAYPSGSRHSAHPSTGDKQGNGPSTQQPEPIANPFVIPGIQKAKVDSQLNTSYTFERFIEGDCNRLARSASVAIAQQPGTTSFNPFMLYGGVGLGKTHLIQAVGNYVKEHHSAETVLYVSSERFTTEFVQAIQHNRVSQFSLFYRQIDLLIIDDVQFFGGKEKTQEEFFHIFNALHQNGKQIVLSADRLPREIEGIEERLLSRFQWGLSADLQAPELETRIAILNRKAEDDGIQLSQDVIEFVAHNIKSNIRELEGALIRLLAHSTLHKRDLDLALAKDVLRDLIKEKRVNLTVEEIQRIVCEYFDIPEDLVRARTRKREVVQARQVAMYFAKQFTQHSLKTIGLHFGGRDHSTVIHANKSVENQIETDGQFSDIIDEIRHRIELRSR